MILQYKLHFLAMNAEFNSSNVLGAASIELVQMKCLPLR